VPFPHTSRRRAAKNNLTFFTFFVTLLRTLVKIRENIMMTRGTVRQILQVLKVFHDNQANGLSISRSYQDGVRKVAHENGVAYQTIGDACRRRLRLEDINELLHLLDRWTKGDSNPLIEQLKKNSSSNIHSEILTFFENYVSHQNEVGPDAINEQRPAKSEIFSVTLNEKDARMLRAIAEIEGVAVSEVLTSLAGKCLKAKMKEIAQAY
jgi:hypothetical protein